MQPEKKSNSDIIFKMARNRKIQKYGNADIIRLKPHDREDLGLDYGDFVDIDKISKQNVNNSEDDLKNIVAEIIDDDVNVGVGEK